MLKRGARILGIDDSPFTAKDKRVLVVGVVERAGTVEGVLSTTVQRDGGDATARLLALLRRSRFLSQLRLIMLNSIMLGGFNVVDINRLNRELGVPVVAIVRRAPDMQKVHVALARVKGRARKAALIRAAGPMESVAGRYAQLAGISAADAAAVVKRYRGVPEPVRLAHVIAGGIVRGESRGKA